jgi:uncharacterized protein YjdB
MEKMFLLLTGLLVGMGVSVWGEEFPNIIDDEASIATGVTLNETNLTLTAGSTAQLTATVVPPNATNTVKWTSSNIAVAIVNKEGLVTATGEGTAIITVALTDNSKVFATCTVTVLPFIPVTDVVLNLTRLSLEKGSEEQLIAVVLPTNASNKEVQWFSADPEVATVTSVSGFVTGVSAGTTTVVVYTIESGFSAACTVTVTPATGISGVSSLAEAGISNGILYLNTPESETISLYSVAGSLLSRIVKTAGETQISLARIPDGVLIIKGSSGWIRKVIK